MCTCCAEVVPISMMLEVAVIATEHASACSNKNSGRGRNANCPVTGTLLVFHPRTALQRCPQIPKLCMGGVCHTTTWRLHQQHAQLFKS